MVVQRLRRQRVHYVIYKLSSLRGDKHLTALCRVVSLQGIDQGMSPYRKPHVACGGNLRSATFGQA